MLDLVRGIPMFAFYPLLYLYKKNENTPGYYSSPNHREENSTARTRTSARLP